MSWIRYQQYLPTEAQIEEWALRWPDSNLIVITGALSGVVVLDADPRHGGDESLHDWQKEHAPLPDTLIGLTGGGGQHYWFQHPGVDIRNRANMLPGLDFRGDGGYVVVPPSAHKSGREYAWEVATEDLDIAPLPPALLALVQGASSTTKPFDIEAYLKGTAIIAEGDRNNTLARIAGYFAGPAQNWNEQQVLNAVEKVNQVCCQEPLKDREVETIVHSICEREARNKETKRQVAEGTVEAIVNADLSPDDRLEQAGALWAALGVPTTTDWYLLRGESVEYILVTPENELRIGRDLLKYREIRSGLLNGLGVLAPAPNKENLSNWPPTALALRLLAREEEIEAPRASDRVSEWVESYIQVKTLYDPDLGQREETIRGGPILVNGRVHLRAERLAEHLEYVQRDKFSKSQMNALLKRAGWENKTVADGDHRTFRCWAAPV